MWAATLFQISTKPEVLLTLGRHSQSAVVRRGPTPRHRIQPGLHQPNGGHDVSRLAVHGRMDTGKNDPGTVFVLENQAKMGHAQNPFVAVMSCPRCGHAGIDNAPPALCWGNDDLRRRCLFGRVPAGRREYLLPKRAIDCPVEGRSRISNAEMRWQTMLRDIAWSLTFGRRGWRERRARNRRKGAGGNLKSETINPGFSTLVMWDILKS